jgi:hypothetical protein
MLQPNCNIELVSEDFKLYDSLINKFSNLVLHFLFKHQIVKYSHLHLHCFLAYWKSIVICIPHVLQHFRCDSPNFMRKTEHYWRPYETY